MCSGETISVAQNDQREITIEAWKWLFLLLKPKWHLDIKLEAFYQFSRTVGAFLFRKLFIDFRHFWVFVFCHRAYSKTRKPKKIFRSSFLEVLRLVICLILSTLPGILCVQDISQSVAQSYQLAFTIINYYLESGFSGY